MRLPHPPLPQCLHLLLLRCRLLLRLLPHPYLLRHRPRYLPRLRRLLLFLRPSSPGTSTGARSCSAASGSCTGSDAYTRSCSWLAYAQQR